MTHTAASVESVVGMNPFVGLRSIEEKDALFGRDADFLLVRDRIYSGRTTLLFAGSGVGKTSFLRSKLIPGLRASTICCYHRSWSYEEPLVAVLQSVREGLLAAGSLNDRAGSTLKESLQGFQRTTASTTETGDLPLRVTRSKEREFLLILDQFEEVFQYWSLRPELSVFLDDLSAISNDESLRVRVMLSMRDDFLGQLSVFDNRVPDLFNNYYRLKHVTKMQAIEIIRGIEPEADIEGVKELVRQLATAQRPENPREAQKPEVEHSGRRLRIILHRAAGPLISAFRYFFPKKDRDSIRLNAVERDLVVLPYLQIVCKQLWQDRKDGVFLDGFGKAKEPYEKSPPGILDSFCRDHLNGLKSARERDLAARAFDFLMTREGAKMAYELSRLAEHMGVSKKELEPVLLALSHEDVRILRRFKGADGSWWFELYHDMYAPFLYEWKRVYQNRRIKARQWRGLATIAVVVLILAWLVPAGHDFSLLQNALNDYPGAAYEQLTRRLTLRGHLPLMRRFLDESMAQYWDRRALRAEMDEDPDRSILYRLQAFSVRPNEDRRRAIVLNGGSDYLDHLVTTIRPSGDVSLIRFSPDDKEIFVASSDGKQIWDAASGTLIASSLQTFRAQTERTAESELTDAAFLTGNKDLLALTKSNALQSWKTSGENPSGSAPLESDRELCDITAFALDTASDAAFVVSTTGLVRKVRPEDLKLRRDNPNTCEDKQRSVAAGGTPSNEENIVSVVPIKESVLTVSQQGEVREHPRVDLNSSRLLVKRPALVAFDPERTQMAVLRKVTPDRLSLQMMTLQGRPMASPFDLDGDIDNSSIRFLADGSAVLIWDDVNGRGRIYRIYGRTITPQTTISGLFDTWDSSKQGIIAAISDDRNMVWLSSQLRSGLLAPLIHSNTSELAFSPGGTYLATTGSDKTVRIWRPDPTRPYPINNGTFEASTLLNMSENGSCLAYTVDPQSILLRKLEVGASADILLTAKPLPAQFVVANDCRTVAGTWKDGSVRLWHGGGDGNLVEQAEVRNDLSPRLVFSPDSLHLAVSSSTNSSGASPGYYVHLWNVRSTPSRTLSVIYRRPLLRPVAEFSRDSRLLRVTSRSSRLPTIPYVTPLRMWWVDSAQEIHLPFTPVYGSASLSYNSDATVMSAAGSDGIYRIDLRNPKASEQIFPGSVGAQSIAFSPDGVFAVIGGSLRFWNAKTHQVENGGGRNDFSSVRVDDAEPKYFITTFRNGSIQLWQSGRALTTDQGASSGKAGSTKNPIDFPMNPIGSPVSLQPGSADARYLSPSSIVSAEFSSDGKSVVVVTPRWAHLLTVTDSGLKPVGSRAFRFTVHVRNRIHFLNDSGSRIVVLSSIPDVGNSVEVVEFNAEPAPSEESVPSLDDWGKKVGLRLEQGSVLSR